MSDCRSSDRGPELSGDPVALDSLSRAYIVERSGRSACRSTHVRSSTTVLDVPRDYDRSPEIAAYFAPTRPPSSCLTAPRSSLHIGMLRTLR